MAEVEDACGAMDFLSELPDDLLSHILSFLDLKRAARAKLLSRRWKHLYPANPVIHIYLPKCDDCCFSSCAELKDHRDNFAAEVDTFMQQFRAPKIEDFYLDVPYDVRLWTDCASFVDEWIRLACLMKAEGIYLWFQHFPGYEHKPYTFPFHLLSAAGSSNLKNLLIDNCAFPPLSSLAGPIISLRNLDLGNASFEDISSYFPKLEALRILGCEQLTTIQQLDDICSRLFYLQSLHIWISRSVGPKFFETPSTNLTNFTSAGGAKCLLFKGLKGLQDLQINANFSGHYAESFLFNLPEESPHLVRLSIDTLSEDFLVRSFMSKFKFLKYLNLSVCTSPAADLRKLSNFLKAAPLLQEFVLNLDGESRGPEQSEQFSTAWLEEQLSPHVMQHAHEMQHVHSCLRKIFIGTGGCFQKNAVRLIIILLKYATALKRMELRSYNKEQLWSALAPYFPRVSFII